MSGLSDRLESGIGLTLAMQAFTMLDHLASVDGMGPVGEIRLVPDPTTFAIAPYAPHTATVLVDMQTLDGQPYAADGRAFLKRLIARAADDHDLSLVAAFEPKPWSDQAGNGCHLHFSGWTKDQRVNRFYDADGEYNLSTLARQFMAGILDHLPALVALTCASVNSYRRLQPQMWASAYRAWGPDNREGALRVASPFRGHEAESTNVELKSSDSSANPYISLAGVMAAGLDGIERQLTLPPPVTVDPHTLDERERKQIGADRLQTSLKEAIANLKTDRLLLDAMGERLATSYIAVKELDVDAFAAADEAFEFRQHIYKY